MRHVLQMMIHLVFHVIDDTLGDPGIDIALQDADQLADTQSAEGHDQQADQQCQILTYQRLVYDASSDDGGHQSYGSRQQDGHKHKGKLQPVRP